MTTFYGYKRLVNPEDWKEISGAKNWVAERSAYELANAWHTAGGMPRGIAAALETSGVTSLFGLRLDTAIVEKPVVLDNEKAPSMTDVMGYARNAAGDPVILAVEGKAQESFGLPVRSWLRGDALEPPVDATPRKSRTRRFNFLCARLGLGVDLECALRYQLLHRTVSAVMEAELHAAAAAVVIVHAFGATSAANWKDFELFLEALYAGPAAPGKVTSPVRLGSQRSTETCFLWWQDPFHTPTA